MMMIESPFRSSNHIDAAIDVMRVFSTDLVVAVRPDHDNFYRHDGYGLSPLRKGALLTLETEDLFRECGQLRILNVGHLLRPEREKPPRIGHVTLDQMAAFVINSEWDWNLAGLIAERAILKETSA
ncbi:MAG: hypothetical protein EPN26_10935 [Rhodospirillales bacterium]|nr:MAG: hypothetical protein EPN26_10935 [Rhodospirillales bacterium]